MPRTSLTQLSYTIAPEIFDRFPGYARGVVVANGVKNGISPPDLVRMLREVEESVRRAVSLENITEHACIKPWREAYKAFGAKPSEYRSSVEAMARRVLRGDELPSINALVDIGNMLSLRHLVPVGGHSMDDLKEDIALRFATGEENFIPFGSTVLEHPLPGEVIFTEGSTVLTRRWTWRQANHSLTLPGTNSIEFNIDRLPPVEMEEIHDIAREVMDLVERFCGGKLRYEILSASQREMQLR